MGRVCSEVQDWIEEQVEQPIEEWENRQVDAAITNGCSFTSTHNYVVIEAKPTDSAFVASHEMGHSCWLPHDSDATNLMNPTTPDANPVLSGLQISVIRWSKHCVYI